MGGPQAALFGILIHLLRPWRPSRFRGRSRSHRPIPRDLVARAVDHEEPSLGAAGRAPPPEHLRDAPLSHVARDGRLAVAAGEGHYPVALQHNYALHCDTPVGGEPFAAPQRSPEGRVGPERAYRLSRAGREARSGLGTAAGSVCKPPFLRIPAKGRFSPISKSADLGGSEIAQIQQIAK